MGQGLHGGDERPGDPSVQGKARARFRCQVVVAENVSDRRALANCVDQRRQTRILFVCEMPCESQYLSHHTPIVTTCGLSIVIFVPFVGRTLTPERAWKNSCSPERALRNGKTLAFQASVLSFSEHHTLAKSFILFDYETHCVSFGRMLYRAVADRLPTERWSWKNAEAHRDFRSQASVVRRRDAQALGQRDQRPCSLRWEVRKDLVLPEGCGRSDEARVDRQVSRDFCGCRAPNCFGFCSGVGQRGGQGLSNRQPHASGRNEDLSRAEQTAFIGTQRGRARLV